jgi:hypothetical protein
VDTILPTSPVYNVKYVRIYDSTPRVVYVGYTPGYTGSYVYYNTIFYGSGWYYPPWVSPYYYYPRYSTWGFNVSYNPWYGWSFGLSWGWGPFSVGYYSGGYWHNNHYWHHRYYGHWGPGGYRPRPVHYGRYGYGRDRYGHSDYGGGGGYGRGGGSRHTDGGYGPDTRQRNHNLYRDRAQRARIADTRDRQMRKSAWQGGNTRQAKYKAALGRQEEKIARQNKAYHNKAGRISPADLRMKADLQDANFKASRSKLLADNRGNVYYKPDRGLERYAAISRSDLLAKGTRNRASPAPRNNRPDVKKYGNRITPAPRIGRPDVKQKVIRTSDKKMAKRTAKSPAKAKSRR